MRVCSARSSTVLAYGALFRVLSVVLSVALSERMLKCYTEHRTEQGYAATPGCLPTLVQIPVFIGYSTLLPSEYRATHMLRKVLRACLLISFTHCFQVAPLVCITPVLSHSTDLAAQMLPEMTAITERGPSVPHSTDGHCKLVPDCTGRCWSWRRRTCSRSLSSGSPPSRYKKQCMV